MAGSQITLPKGLEQKLGALPDSIRQAMALSSMRTIYLNDFFLFSKWLLGFKDLDWNVHGQFIQAFESDAKRKLLVMPRGTFKSSLGSVAYPVWRALKDPDITILIDSEVYTNSKNFLREIKGHILSDKVRMVFGDLVGNKWDEGEILFNTRKRNRKEATITVGGIGTVKVGQHYDLMIGDDYNSAQNSDSPEKCQKVIDHVRYNLNILNPGGEYVFIGTRYAQMDVIGFLLSEVLNEKHLSDGRLMRFVSELKEGLLDEF